MVKIINIFYHSASPAYSQNWQFDLFSSKGHEWHAKLAKQILKHTKEYQLECWQPEIKIKTTIVGENDGIVFRAFPSIRLGYKRFGTEVSYQMLRYLKSLSLNEQIIIHLHGIHGLLPFFVAYLFKDIPIVGTHLGDPPFRYLLHSNSLIRRFGSIPLALLEPYALKNVERIFAGTREENNILSKYHTGVEFFHAIGIDFEKYKPINKLEARDMLNLPQQKKILLFVGRLRRGKGVDIILNTYKQLKKIFDVQLLLAGAEKDDELYNEATKQGAIIINRIPSEQLVPYYCAADVYLLPIFDRDILLFKGFGIAPIECLACGTPIVGTNLSLFMGNDEELKALGKIPENPADVVNCISSIFDDPSPYANCREIAKKYYDWDVIVKRILAIYEQLEVKYYGQSSKK